MAAPARTTSLAGALVVIVGGLVLAGWALDIAALKSVVSGFVSMKPNTALAFVLAGTALLLLARPSPSPRRTHAGQWLALLVFLIGAVTLCEFLFDWQVGIDEVLFKDDPNAAATLIPGRMAPSTAMCFVLLGLALFGIGWEPRRGFRPAEVVAVVVAVVSLSSLAEYVFDQPILYSFSQYTRMALHTAVVFLLLSTGVLLARPAQGMVGTFRSGRVSSGERAVYAAMGLALLIVLAGGAWFYHAQEQQVRRNVEAELEVIAQLKADQIVQWRAERLGDGGVMAGSQFFADGVASWLASPQVEIGEKILARFRALQRSSHYHDVLLVDGRGQVRLSLSDRPPAFHEDTAQALATALRTRQPVLTDLHVPPGDLTPHLEVIAPLFAGKETRSEPIGAVVLQYEARQFLYPLINSWPTPSPSGETLLVRREGDAVLFLNDLRHRPDTAFKLRIPLTRRDVASVMAALGKEGVYHGVDYRGVKVLSVLKRIPYTSWSIVAKVDETEALAEWRFRAGLIVAVILALVLALAAAAGLIWLQRAKYRDLSQSTEALRESQALYSSLVEQMPAGVFRKDREGRYVFVSPWFCRLKGLKKEEFLGRTPREVAASEAAKHDPTGQAIKYAVDGMDHHVLIMQTGNPVELVEEYTNAAGRKQFVHAIKFPVLNSAEKIIGTQAVLFDITARKQAEQKIQQLNAELEQRVRDRTAALEAANKELETFSYSVSHDLRAPLRSIDGFSRILLEDYRDKLDDEGKDNLTRVRAASQRMALLIDDLLKLSHAGRTEMRRTALDLTALAGEIAAELQRAEPARPVRWVIAPNLAATGDTQLLRVNLENLLGNAWKFTSKRTDAVIEFGATDDDRGRAFFVRDNGAGFDMTYAPKLFGAFQRLHTSADFPGTGIGLATVQRIIHRHGGRVWAEGEVNHGATFYFTLPEPSQPT